jgi:hypothetical protein
MGTITRDETTFNSGAVEARSKFGVECRPMDETLFGLRAVLRAGGREYEITDLYNRWHCPVCISEGFPLDRLTPALVGEAERIVERYGNKFQIETRDRHYVIQHGWDQVRLWDFKRQVLQLIETDIRRHKPGLRKNNVEFKRLAQLVFAEAQMGILKTMADKLTTQMGTLRIHLNEEKPGTIAREAASLRESGEHLQEIAADVTVLQPGAAVLEPLYELGERFLARAVEMLKPVETAIADMDRVWHLICDVQVILTKADVARRARFRTLKEADDRGLKGVGRRQFEEQAQLHMADADKAQVEADKLLRKENLLGQEEEMTCVF